MNKVTKDGMIAKIKKVKYARVSEKFTHCIITLKNGFEVTGESACVDPANYNQEIGEGIAYDNAFEKIWALEGYLLQEKLYLKNKFESKNKGWSTSPNEALNLEVLEDRQVGIDDEVKKYPVTPDKDFIIEDGIEYDTRTNQTILPGKKVTDLRPGDIISFWGEGHKVIETIIFNNIKGDIRAGDPENPRVTINGMHWDFQDIKIHK